MASANQVLSKFIASGQVWYVSQPDKQPALLTEIEDSGVGHDGVCLFPNRKEALRFLRVCNAQSGRFRPRRGAPHPHRPETIGSFVRSCRLYSPYLCLPRPAAGGERFNFYFLEIKQLLVAVRQAHAPAVSRPSSGDLLTEQVYQSVFGYQRLRFSDN